ncbi:hypothetical protein RUND412_010004 [Rhizina undulata]
MPRTTRRTAALAEKDKEKERDKEEETPVIAGSVGRRVTSRTKEPEPELVPDVGRRVEKRGGEQDTQREDDEEGKAEDPVSAQLLLENQAKAGSGGKKQESKAKGKGKNLILRGKKAKEEKDEETERNAISGATVEKEKERGKEKELEVAPSTPPFGKPQFQPQPPKTPRFDPLIHGLTPAEVVDDQDWSEFFPLKKKNPVKPKPADTRKTATATEAKTSSTGARKPTTTDDDVKRNSNDAEVVSHQRQQQKQNLMQNPHARTAHLNFRSRPASVPASLPAANTDGGRGHEVGMEKKKGVFERIPTSSLPKIEGTPPSSPIRIPGAFPSAEKEQNPTTSTAAAFPRSKRPRSPSPTASPEKRQRPSADPQPLASTTRPRTVGISFPPPPTPVRSTKPPTRPVSFTLSTVSSDARIRRAAEVREERRRKEIEEKERRRRFGRQVPPSTFRNHIALHQESFPPLTPSKGGASTPGTPNAAKSFIPIRSPARPVTPTRELERLPEVTPGISVSRRISQFSQLEASVKPKTYFAPPSTPSPEKGKEKLWNSSSKIPAVVFQEFSKLSSEAPSSSFKSTDITAKVMPTSTSQPPAIPFPSIKLQGAPQNPFNNAALLAAAAKLPAMASTSKPAGIAAPEKADEATANPRMVASEKGKEAIKAWAEAQRQRELQRKAEAAVTGKV